jgi:iron complex outermembrane recepter protein
MKSIYILLCLGFWLPSNAQNTLSGIITNKQDMPLDGVLITIPEIQKEIVSDLKGSYTLSNLPSGSFKIVFSFFGYEKKTLDVALNHGENILNVILSTSANHIDEIIVSTAFNKIQSQNVMKVEHQSMKELLQKGNATLIESLATIPGVSQVATGGGIGKPVIRGLSGNRVLVYTQGVRLENQQFGEEHGLGLNDAGVESVEVIKGPASLLYGSDALGGVLYFNPEGFAKPNKTEGSFSHKVFSNTLGSNNSLGFKTATEKWKFLVRGTYNSHIDYTIPNGDKVTNSRFLEKDFKAGLGYTSTVFSSVMRYNYNNLNLGLPEAISDQSSSREPDYPRQGIDNHIVSLHNKLFFKNSKMEADFGYIFNNRKEFADNPDPILQMDLKTLNYDLKYFLPKWHKLEAIVGVQGMSQTNKNLGQELLIPDATTNDFGVLATANYQWETTALQAGIRFDNRKIDAQTSGVVNEEGYFEAINKSFNSFNASLGYKTNVTSKMSIRLNIASGFRAPNLAELTSNGVHEGSNRYEIGNAALKSEQNIQSDLNLEYNNSHVEVFVNGFYNHINNYIFIAPNGAVIDGNNVYDYVQSNARLYGGEMGLHFHPHPLDWLHYSCSFESVRGQKSSGDFLPFIPANKFNNTLRAEFDSKKWLSKGYASLNADYFLAQNSTSEFETISPSYTLVNLGIGGNIMINTARFEVSLNATNLFNQTYTAHLSRLKTFGIPNMGRNVVLGLSFEI